MQVDICKQPVRFKTATTVPYIGIRAAPAVQIYHQKLRRSMSLMADKTIISEQNTPILNNQI